MLNETILDIPKSPGRTETVLGYAERLNDCDRRAAIGIGEQIANPGHPLAKFLVLIPVAAHQEAPQIASSLSQYASQKTEQPFSLILGLNAPNDMQDSHGVLATLQEVEAAKERHPNLDVRTSLIFYAEPKIGQIRRDLWNAALLTSLSEGAYENPHDEVVGLNHDIDLVKVNAGYMQRVQQFFNGRQWLYDKSNMDPTVNSIRSTVMRHAPSPAHPNISKATFWGDYVNYSTKGTYEASLAIPFSAYADAGGFPAEATSYETVNFKDLIAPAGHSVIKGAYIQTSPRRYIDRLQYGMDRIWEEGTFGSSDDCRDGRDRSDLSQHEVEELLMRENYFRRSIEYMAVVAMAFSARPFFKTKEQYAKIADNSLRIAEKTAAINMGSERLAKVVATRRNNTGLSERLIAGYVSGQDLGAMIEAEISDSHK